MPPAPQAPAARAAAPLAHDFSTISLSALLTPCSATEATTSAVSAGLITAE